MGFNGTTTLNVSSSVTKVMLCRQAGYPAWGTQVAAGAFAYGLGWRCEQKASAQGAMIIEPIPGNVRSFAPGVTYATTTTDPGIVYSGVTPLTLTAPYPLIGIDQGTGPLEWLYVPSNTTLNVGLTRGAQGTVMHYVANLEVWDAPGQTGYITMTPEISVTTALSSWTSLTFTGDVWVRLKALSINLSGTIVEAMSVNLIVTYGTGTIGATLNSAGTLTLTANANAAVFLPLVGPVEHRNSQLPWFSTRVTAASMLMTNTTKVMNKEGTVLWGRIPPSVGQPWLITPANINALHPAEKAFLPLESGTYTYVPPSTDMANFWDYTSNSYSNSNNMPVYRLDNDALVNIGFINDPDGATNLAVSVDWHIEFRTTSTLFDIGLSVIPIEALHAAQIALVKSGFFFDNFNHVALLNKIVSTLGGLSHFMNVMTPMVRGIRDSSNRASGSSIMSKKTTTPSATTAARSGITGTRQAVTRSASIARWADSVRRPQGPASAAGSARSRRSVGARSAKSRRSRRR